MKFEEGMRSWRKFENKNRNLWGKLGDRVEDTHLSVYINLNVFTCSPLLVQEPKNQSTVPLLRNSLAFPEV